MPDLNEWFKTLKSKNGFRVLAKNDREMIEHLVNEQARDRTSKTVDVRIIKTPGPEYVGGPMRGHCYDGPGWNECTFWKHGEGESRCMFFGGPEGVLKRASESLRICDKMFGVRYDGEA